MTNQTATRKFTDRTEPQAAFQNAYLDLASRMPGSNNSQILTYYGMGGIGKSTLLEKLADNLKTQRAFTEKNNGKPLFVSLNFEVCQEDIQVLTRLRNILSDSYGWQFPLFELGLYLYGRSIGEDIDLPETKTVAGQQAPLVRFAIDMASELPVVGPFLKIFSLVDQGQAALRTLLNQHKDLVQQFEKYSPTQQREALPGLFAADLNAYTEKVKAPLVLFLDTYECIEERAATQGSAMRRDYWLHGDSRLIAETKNALWVIAGRNQIQWSVAGCPMEQHLLGSLSDEDACSFLIGAGLPEDLIPHIYKLTNGLPLYLDVCVAHYEQLLERGETPDISKFGIGGSERLIECYIRYMDKSVKELVYMLTFFPEWDEKLVRKASTEILGSFSLADFKRVKKLSITTKLDETHYFIHRTVSEILRQDSDNDLQEYAANFLINYFSPVLDEASPYSEQYSNALANVMHGGLLLHENREDLVVFYRDHIKKRMNTLHSCHRDDQIKKIFTPFWEHASAKSDDSLYAFALSERAWRMFQSKDIRRDALDWTMQALQLNYKLLGENHLDTIDILHTLAGLLDLNYHHSDAIAAYQYVADKYKAYFPDRQSGLFNIKRNLALAYLSIRDYTHSDALFEELLEDYKTHFGREDQRTLRAMRDVAVSYRRQGNYEQSRELFEQALDLSSKTFGEDHPDTIMSMVGLATTCQRQGDFQRELELLEKIIDMRCRLQGEGHPDTQRALENLAARYSALENFSKSISVWERLLKTRRISEGEDHFKTTNAIINIARNYIKLHDHAKIIALYMDTLEIWRTLWANDQQRILKSWDTIVRGISSSGEYELAAQLYELVLIGPQGALLAINPATSLLIHNLAECYYCFGNYEAAYSVLKDLLAWEADHTPFTSQTAAFLANVLCKLGRDDEATQVVEQYPDKLPFSRRSPFVPTSKPVPNWAPTLQPAPPSAPTPRPAPSPSLSPRPIPVRPSVSYSGLSLTEVMDEIGKTLERHKLRAAPPPKPVGSKGAPSTISLKELLELVQK